MQKPNGDPYDVYSKIRNEIFGENSYWDNAIDRARLCERPDHDQKIYWHYCKAETFKSIVETKKVILSESVSKHVRYEPVGVDGRAAL